VANADGLENLFDDEPASKALVAWARKGVHADSVRPSKPLWQPLGQSASGALLTAVVVKPKPGVVVVKVSAHGQEDEGRNHAAAHETAKDHVTKPLPWSWPVEDGRMLTFQSPATGSLRDVRAMAAFERDDELPAGCAYLTKWLLTEWNKGPGGGTSDCRPVGELLREELGALVSRDGSALAYGSRIGGLEADTPWIRVDGLDLPNPLALATGGAGHPELDILRGRAHGDLHLHNVLVPFREGSARFEEFQLIDLATFSDNAPLSRDVAMLLLSALEPTAREQPTDEGDALLHYLVRPHKRFLRWITPVTRDLVQAVQDTCRNVSEGGLYDVWVPQFLFSLVATGLRFSTYENMGDGGRWWYFRLAAHAGGELLKWLQDRPFPTGVPITAPVPAGPRVTSGSPAPLDQRSPKATGAADSTAGAASVSGGAATGRSEELRRLEAYSRTAVVAAGHQGAAGAQAQPLDLAALAVPRDLERDLLDLLDKGRSACVKGEPGTGKTTLLWRLHRELTADRVGPRPYFLRAGDLWNTAPGAGLTLDTVRAACRFLPGPAVFLFDTADLLTSDTAGVILLQELLTIAAENSVRVLMTCREREWDALKPHVEDFHLEQHRLGPYSPREQEAAIRSHARYFYEGEPEVSVDEVCRNVTKAAVQGLPMREVCAAPLTLRMLFETFAPKPPLVEEIDTAKLYDLYWTHRVSQDQRAGDALLTGTVPPPDLSEAGEELAQLMLEEGRVELSGTEVRNGPRTSFQNPETARSLQGLVARGVVERQGAGATERYSYFHQTLFEYAAGRRLSRTAASDSPSLLGELLDWLKEHPDDQFRLAVAEQALVQAGRAGGRAAQACTELLTRTLADTWDDHSPELDWLRAMQVRVYARLPAPDAALRRHFTPRIATLKPTLAKVYLRALPTTCHEDGERIVDDLLGLWRGGHDELRQPALIALTWFAETLPESVITVFDRTCPSSASGKGACRGTLCDPRQCVWAWLLTLHNSEMYKFLGVLESLAPKRPDWVWHRLRMVMTDPHRDLLPMARCLRLAARRQNWPERPYPAVRHVVRHRWGHDLQSNKNGVQVQAALGRLMASSWLTSVRQPALDAVLRSSARRPEEFTSYAQVRAVAQLALQATPDEIRHLLEVLEEITSPASLRLLSTCLLLPLLTATHETPDTIGGDNPSRRVPGPEPAATKAVRNWLAQRLRAHDRAAPADAVHQLAVDTWKRDLDVATTARLVSEAWPEDTADRSAHRRDEQRTEEGLRRVWLTDPNVATLLVAAAAAGQPQARKALRLWRADRARSGSVRGLARGTGVTQTDKKIARSLQGLVPQHPELLDELFAGGAVDPRLDPGWLNAVLNHPGADVDRRLAAALRRHSAALEELCDLAWTRDYGAENAQKAIHVRRRLVARGVLSPPIPAQLGEMLDRRHHPHHLTAALLLVETIVEHSSNGSLNTPEWRRLEDVLREFTAAEYTQGRTGQGEQWHEKVQAVARRCLTGLVCRHHPLDTPEQVAQARLSALRYLATTSQIDDVTVLGRFLERLVEAAPQDAVKLVNAAAGKLRTLSTGKMTTLAQRWYSPISRLVERATPEQWRELVEGSWEGPDELLRVLIRSGVRKRTDQPARYLLAIADSSPWPDVIRETVRVGTLLRTEGSPQRWLPTLNSGSRTS
jgi:MoxR-like ATPase